MKAFNDRSTAQVIYLQFSGVEPHNAKGPGETDYAPLLRMFRVIRYKQPRQEPEVILIYAVNASNDTMGPEGIVPSIFVFGTVPSFPALNRDSVAQTEGMEVLELARAEMCLITVELHIKTAQKSRLPPTTKYDICVV